MRHTYTSAEHKEPKVASVRTAHGKVAKRVFSLRNRKRHKYVYQRNQGLEPDWQAL